MALPLLALPLLAGLFGAGAAGTVAYTGNEANKAMEGANEAERNLMSIPTVEGAAARNDSNRVTTEAVQPVGTQQPVRTGPSQAQLDPLLAALSSLDTTRDQGLAAAQSKFDRNRAAYDAENIQDRQNYEKQLAQNEGNLSANRHAALLQASQGGLGLRSVLASLGALSGTGGQLADQAIARAANKDIGAADDAFRTSADTLNTAWSDTERKQRQRDEDAKAAFENEQRSIQQNILQSRQGILTQLSNLFGADTEQGRNYASQAASLYPQIAQNSQRSVGSYQAASPLYSEQALDTYKGGVRDLTVGTRAGGGNESVLNSPLFALPGARRREEELV